MKHNEHILLNIENIEHYLLNINPVGDNDLWDILETKFLKLLTCIEYEIICQKQYDFY